jgi:hypothetical protein
MDSDGNTLSGDSSAPAAPPSSAPAPSSGSGGGSNDLEARNDYGGDGWRDDGEQPVDLDKPKYEPTDARAKLSRLADIAQQEQTAQPETPTEIPIPKAWGKSAREAWDRLDPDTKRLVAENEQAREAHWNAQRSEVDRVRQEAISAAEKQLQPERERIRHARELANLPLEVLQHVQQRDAAETEFRSRYPDLTDASFADQYHSMLYAQDPAKAEQFVSDIHQLSKIAEDAQRVAFRHQQEAAKQEAEAQRARAEQLKQFQASQDAEFAKRNPEFADERKAAEIREKVVVPYLRDQLKLPPERIAYLWDSEPLFRTVEAQQLLLDGARWHAAQQAARNAAPKVAAKPQSGGVNQGYERGDALAHAADSGDMNSYIKLRANGRVR